MNQCRYLFCKDHIDQANSVQISLCHLSKPQDGVKYEMEMLSAFVSYNLEIRFETRRKENDLYMHGLYKTI